MSEPVRCHYCLQPAPADIQRQFEAVAALPDQQDVERVYGCAECTAKHGPPPGDVQLQFQPGQPLDQGKLDAAQEILQRLRGPQPPADELADDEALGEGDDRLTVALQPPQDQAFAQFQQMMQAHPQLIPAFCAELYHLRRYPTAGHAKTARQFQRRSEAWNVLCKTKEYEAQAIADDALALLTRVAALMAQTVRPANAGSGLIVPPGPGGIA